MPASDALARLHRLEHTTTTQASASVRLAEVELFFLSEKLIALLTGGEVLILDDAIIPKQSERLLTLWHKGQPSRKVDPFTFSVALVDGLTASAETLRVEILSYARS